MTGNSDKIRGVLHLFHRRFSFQATRYAWLLLLCVWICAFIAPAQVEAVVLPSSKIASWGFEASPSGRVGGELPANQYSIGSYKAYGCESVSRRAEFLSRDPIEETGGMNFESSGREQRSWRYDGAGNRILTTRGAATTPSFHHALNQNVVRVARGAR